MKTVSRVRNSVYVAVIFLMMFGVSAIGKAAQRLKRIARNTRDFLRSSQSAYLLSKPWGFFVPAWRDDRSGQHEEMPEAIAVKESLTDDPAGRIESDFKVPSGMKGRVGFWMDVYARYSSEFRIIHDRNHPEQIYGILDLRPIYRAYSNRRTADAKAYQVEKKVIKELKVRLAESMEGARADTMKMSGDEKAEIRGLLARFEATTPDAVFVRIRNVRTQTGQRDFFLKAMRRSRFLLPQIETIFKEQGLPLALTRLPFVESSFNIGALSKTGAIGIWQFMPDTARIFNRRGTRRDWADPIKQSRSAAKLFISIRKNLPDWSLAVTGYNSGPMRLVRLSKKYDTNHIEKLIDVPSSRDTLGFAGKNFFSELLAANLVEAYKDKLFPPSALEAPSVALQRKVQSVNAELSQLVMRAKDRAAR